MIHQKLRHVLGLICTAFLVPCAAHGQSFDLIFPGSAEVTAQISNTAASRALPKAPFQNGGILVQNVDGPLAQTAFRIASDAGLTTLELITPLRAQITKAGFDTLFECETRACGGFDFRYGIDLLPEPDMHVDLGDFRYVLARRGAGASSDYISLMVSRSPTYGFVHLTRMGSFAAASPRLSEATKSPLLIAQPAEASPAQADYQLNPSSRQAQVLEDLIFAPSTANLTAGEYASLQGVSDWLTANATGTVQIIGHTDSSGKPDANMSLSRARADSIRDWLIAQYGAAPDRITATGMGDTAPRTGNDTAKGRAKNRRVEAIFTPTP